MSGASVRRLFVVVVNDSGLSSAPLLARSSLTLLAAVRRLPVQVLVFLIELYRTYVSPLRLPTCRFTPTCSEYAVTALRERGFVVGSVLTIVRLAKCAPWHPGGWDPVPERAARPNPHRHTVESSNVRSA